MAIPSGSGTEVLKRNQFAAVTNSEQKIIDGVANHIYTVLNVIFCEQGNAEELIHLFIFPSATSGSVVYLLGSQVLGAQQTFTWNDRIILSGTDELVAQTSSSANVDIIVNYIDQDWT